MPHIIPCPAPRTQFAEYEITEDGRQRRRRKPSTKGSDTNNDPEMRIQGDTPVQTMAEHEQEVLRKKAHECPVPKPGGRIGEMLGFPKKDEMSKPSRVHVERRTS
ncbi:MAG: hypothetical protein Q9180_008118, partial [Flavoplaca navasiana]